MKFNLRVEPFLRKNVFVASQKVQKRNMQYATAAAAAAVALDTHAYMQGRVVVVVKKEIKKNKFAVWAQSIYALVETRWGSMNAPYLTRCGF